VASGRKHWSSKYFLTVKAWCVKLSFEQRTESTAGMSESSVCWKSGYLLALSSDQSLFEIAVKWQVSSEITFIEEQF